MRILSGTAHSRRLSVSYTHLDVYKRQLVDYDLALDDKLVAVSNVMTGTEAKVKIRKGYLFVMQTRD